MASRAWSGFHLRLLGSQLLALANPLQLTLGVAQDLGQLWVVLRCRGRLPSPESYRPRATYRVPVQGRWEVLNGGPTRATSHSWIIPNQRFAYDLFKVDEHGNWLRGEGRRLEDYLAYGAAVVAPADGIVVRRRDGIADARWPGSGFIDVLAADFRGNFLVIRHASREYSVLCHLMRGTILKAPGDRVRAGEPVARCGNSGHSTEPHLHFHVQDRQSMFLAAGLPVPLAQADGAPPTFLERGDTLVG